MTQAQETNMIVEEITETQRTFNMVAVTIVKDMISLTMRMTVELLKVIIQIDALIYFIFLFILVNFVLSNHS